jgi:hypothetical protein
VQTPPHPRIAYTLGHLFEDKSCGLEVISVECNQAPVPINNRDFATRSYDPDYLTECLSRIPEMLKNPI